MIGILLALVLLALIVIALKLPLLVAIAYGGFSTWKPPAEREAERARRRAREATSEDDLPQAPALPEGMRRDVELGLLYLSPPPEAQQDDLTKIKGVGAVLKERLHSFGVYTYWQIAGWDDDVAACFSERLSFKARIERDQWREQCAKLQQAEAEL